MYKSFLKSRFLLLLLGAFFAITSLYSQNFEVKPFGMVNHTHAGPHTERCGHTILEQKIEKELGPLGSKDAFENWIDQKIQTRRNSPKTLARTQNDPIKIPVVVHIIHSGTSIGQGANIPDSQVFEQIRVLNEDFNRTNADAVNTPAEFLPVAGTAGIEFVLAKQDEDGLPTNGIVRVQGPQPTYSPNDATLIGQISQWNPEEYMNIWVVPLVQPFIGYASFPISDLPGLNFPAVSAITDGVTVDYRFFGVGGNSVSSTSGRTATHEVGHYLGLRHIWGDGGCGVDDFVEDTPEQDNSNNNCSPNVSRFSCGSNDMIQNYMDYTPDACMNLFTMGQVERFHVVLENSPRRITLVNNRATEDPELPNRDLGISRVLEPSDFACDALIQPSIEVLNAGEDRVTNATITLTVNGNLVETRNSELDLITGEHAIIDFNDFNLPQNSNTVEFEIISVNDNTDENPDNNLAVTNPVIQRDLDLPYSFDISDFPERWTVDNPDGLLTWDQTTINITGQLEDAIFINNYDYEAPGQLDYLISPKIDLERYPNAQVVFELSYGPYAQPGFDDRLVVAISEDCGGTFDVNSAVFDKTRTRLETSQPTLDAFIPSDPSQFRTELLNLNRYSDLGQIRLAIVNENGFGNNLYIKNIRILPNEEFNYNLELVDLLAPSPVVDGTQEDEQVILKNTGNLPITGFLFTRSTNGSTPETFVAQGSTVLPGETTILNGSRTTRAGKNRLDFTVFDPNFDVNGNNRNSFTRFIIEDDQTIVSPWRQNFNDVNVLNSWTVLNPQQDGNTWRLEPVSSGSGPGNVVVMENNIAGQSHWLASPIFDLTKRREASFFFDVSAGEVNPEAILTLLASDNGGETYSEVWSAAGSSLSNVGVGESNPNAAGDFVRNYVNLTDFAGAGKTEIRLAFVLTGATANDSPIYLDNFEVFLSANPNPVIPTEGMTILYPNPARDFFNLAFNLARLETVNIKVISASGTVVQDIDYPQTLNQTYTFSTELFRPGVYIIQISSESIQEIKRLIVN
ncbi:T9SS-dependent choice-of-anchor J family protein [Algoriphagus sediminis]|uniref:Choice-of-anchor J domain-containing protein n=1 Tax=Algoriphagus sediminis TaxID=3057113 RepID=A0ABT7YA16_9BACT|nr:choice-of-anchor J domain-containing protein [Algoriphagus sediminis]MDN3203356.1 choice-of-anchor J domain-containing protein [Algoriphagus sediminis]